MNNIKNNSETGSALVEMAIILPVLVLFVFGICEFGWAMYVNNTLNQAAREGARVAAVTPTPITVAAVGAQVRRSITFAYAESDLAIAATPERPASGAPVTVTVTLRYHSFTGLFSSFFIRPLRGEATMRYEL